MYYSVGLTGVIFITFVSTIWAECGGRTVVHNVLNGTITLDRHTYSTNTHCEWLIKAPQPGQKILLIFKEFNTECCFDYLKIYDGLSKQKRIGSFSGIAILSSLMSNTSAIVLEFFSDNHKTNDGFVIDFLITDCPKNCSSHGRCIENQCVCDELFTGVACDIEICPEFCNNVTGNGQCSQSKGCECTGDFIGESCSFSLIDDVTTGSWRLIGDYSTVFSSRFAHAGAYVYNAFWIFGGSDLNEVYDDLVKFNLDEKEWQLIQPIGDRPTARFRHTMVSYKDALVVFGGELANGTLLNELWIFNISTTTWRRVHGSNNPPGLASHCASIHDDQLIVFGGQSQDYGFSYRMYTYDLVLQNDWKTITYNLAKISNLRLIGHSCVFYPTLKSLIVFGGYRVISGRISTKLDTLLLYHMDGKVWFDILSSAGPKPTAYHTAVIMGDYMVSYGGVRHVQDETCYANEIYLFNLKTFSWSSLISDTRNSSNILGRYSHVAAAFNQNTLLVLGGFSGIALGDFLAYKIPSNIINDHPNSTHSCRMFSQCLLCLTWGSHSDHQCGWCVQDSTCYPRGSPSGPCSTTQTTRGWWGNEGSFLISVDECRIQDNSPGLMSNVKFGNELDDVHIINPLRGEFYTDPHRTRKTNDVNVRWFGFIYPFISQSTDEPVTIKLRYGKKSSLSLHLSTDELKANTDKVISVNGKDDQILLSQDAKRPNGLPLFPNATVNKKYYIEIKTTFQVTTRNLYLEVLHNNLDVIDGRYIQPFYSDDCTKYPTCLECLSDMSCGWCSSDNMCIFKNSSTKCLHSSGKEIYLVVNATYCETCAQYIDCESCSEDGQCTWFEGGLCYQRKNTGKQCASSCTIYQDCASCITDTKCLWCENQDKCIPSVSLPAAFIYGQCSHWSDSLTTDGQCPSCSGKNECADCLKTTYCGWCGEYHNGSCFAGGYSGPHSGSCNQLVSSNGKTYSDKSYEWSYTVCPDENECITRSACDENADCFDIVGSYRCECKQGYQGNGTFCKPLCNPPCVHGQCIKHPVNDSLDECDCDLGWTGAVCSQDCGCHNHSTCETGIGVCDSCQDLTQGQNCEFCVAGSYGNAVTSTGCKRCECNGHGDEQRGICDSRVGHCFCMNNTMGVHCDQCLPGFSGHPERGEGCYYPCKTQVILSNMTQGTLSSLPEADQEYNPNNVKCLWIITTLTHNSSQVVYSNELAPGTVTFRMKDIVLDCQTDHIYIYDGMPNFKLSGIESSFNLIGSLCGTDPSSIPAIESRSGTLVILFKGNVGLSSRTNGFNATFTVNLCPNSCTGNRYCHNNGTHESCVCKPGWTGTACDDVICPSNCSEGLGHGQCDQISGKCVCNNGYAGPSCNMQHPSNYYIWEYSTLSDSTLARMGHTLIADVQTETLIIYGGYSLNFNILGDVWKYDTKTNNYVQETGGGTMPSPRYFHAADVHKRTMYVTGGITSKGYSSEVWKYNLDTKQWQRGQVLPRELASHTINIINDTLYLIGGYSPDKECSSNVYTLNLDIISSGWIDTKPSGDIFNACFGHTTVYDHATKSLVVFGKQASKMKPTFAILKLTTNEWVIVSGVPQEHLRYFHVSMIVDDVMIVTTGYTGYNVQDFADQPLVYDLKCRSWHRPDLKGNVPLPLAHSAIVSMNDITYIFGGYNGLSSDKLHRQNTSSNWCALFSTEVSCSKVRNCVWCTDAASNLTACYVSNSRFNCTATDNDCQNGVHAMPIASALASWSDVCIEKTVSGGCSSCIQDSKCFWSVDSHLCVSLSFQPITCAFGICGRLLRHYDVCPTSCNTSTYCYDCLEQYNCGWCTDQTRNGLGVCTEGTLQGPYNGTCYSKNGGAETWVSSVCLPEDECSNGHHQCSTNETCRDEPLSYRCECSYGYERKNGSCIPVCSQGCVYGSCIHPNQCYCNFGWVGTNCTTACKCNGQGHCVNETQLDDCSDCRHHTTGPSCDRCLPGYVGENGQCTSCFDMCSQNAEMCYNSNEKNTTESKLFGPRNDTDLHCECFYNSEGVKCESCKSGYFRSQNGCEKCKCRGHSATCDMTSGLNCKCQNNTMTQDSKSNAKQCSQCIPKYLGTPNIEGQQCYRELRVLGHRFFARENSNHLNLLPFQTSLYCILPSYTNMDIRLTFDISYGSLDVYISNSDDDFKVSANQTVSISLPKITSPEYSTDGLNTYTRFSGGTEVIVFKKLKHRLIVTFPSNEHKLDKNKFYIIIKAAEDGANGIIYFKQDITKINLIVFFIVFASCFVFLLSGVSITWSIKNRIRSRRMVHVREVENIRLHSRPFAKFSFLFEYQAPTPGVKQHRKTTASTRKAIQPLGVECTSDYHATITTVLFQMPQTEKTKMTVSLGTTLSLVTPQQMDKLAQPCASKDTTNI